MVNFRGCWLVGDDVAYQLDGLPIEYFDLMDVVLEALQSGVEVYYAFHLGVDLYWVSHPPDWAGLISLTPKGLEAKGKVIEPFAEIELFEIP